MVAISRDEPGGCCRDRQPVDALGSQPGAEGVELGLHRRRGGRIAPPVRVPAVDDEPARACGPSARRSGRRADRHPARRARTDRTAVSRPACRARSVSEANSASVRSRSAMSGSNGPMHRGPAVECAGVELLQRLGDAPATRRRRRRSSPGPPRHRSGGTPSRARRPAAVVEAVPERPARSMPLARSCRSSSSIATTSSGRSSRLRQDALEEVPDALGALATADGDRAAIERGSRASGPCSCRRSSRRSATGRRPDRQGRRSAAAPGARARRGRRRGTGVVAQPLGE